MSAPWRNTFETHESFINDSLATGSYLGGFWTIPGVHTSMVGADLMHCSCIGILHYLAGNVLWDLFCIMGGSNSMFQGASSAGLCGQLCGVVKAAASRLNIQAPFSNLTIHMIRASGTSKPKMKLKVSGV